MERLELFTAIVQNRIQPLRSSNPQQQPHLYYPGLNSKPFYDPSEFPWISALLTAFPGIRADLDRCLMRRQGFETISPGHADGGHWAGLWFYLHGVRFSENCDACPETISAIDRVPRLCRFALFSALYPGTHIKPHCGITNAKLRLHLCVRGETGSRLRVCDDYYEWNEGDVAIFDDSYEHEVWTGGTRPRIVLMIDFWHPELREDEIDFLSTFERTPSPFLENVSLRQHYMEIRAGWKGADVSWVYD
jgi:aspartate beta-hydroxylase